MYFLLPLSLPGRRVVQQNQIQEHNQNETLHHQKRVPDFGEEEEGKGVPSIVGGSSSINGGGRRRSNGNGGRGHQKRHQEWLDKFGEVSGTDFGYIPHTSKYVVTVYRVPVKYAKHWRSRTRVIIKPGPARVPAGVLPKTSVSPLKHASKPIKNGVTGTTFSPAPKV